MGIWTDEQGALSVPLISSCVSSCCLCSLAFLTKAPDVRQKECVEQNVGKEALLARLLPIESQTTAIT